MAIIDFLLIILIVCTLSYGLGLYVGGKKQEKLSDVRIQELERENEQLGKIPMNRFVVHEERRDVVPIIVTTTFPKVRYMEEAKKCGKMAREYLIRELGRRVIDACDIELQEHVPLQEMVFRAKLRIVMPTKQRKLEDMIEEERRKNGGNRMVTFEICEGNPGALTFLMGAYDADPFGAEVGFDRMNRHGITGTKLYMLWNDCCGRDTQQALLIMKVCDVDEIKRHINYEGGRGFPFTTEELEELIK